MRIFDLIREAVPPSTPLQILPADQFPPPAKPAAAAPAKPTAPAAAAPAKPTAPAAAASTPAAPGVVVPNSPKGIVSKAQLDQFRQDSGNPNATLGQFMNQQQGKTFRKGGANDPAVIAARQKQPAGPAVGSQAQTAGGRNELAKVGIAAGSPALQPQQAVAPAPATNTSAYTSGAGDATNDSVQPAATNTSAYTSGAGDATNDPVVVNRNDGVPPPLPAAEPTTSNLPTSFGQSASQNSGYTGGAGNVQDFGVRGTPILPYGQGSPVGGTTNAVTRTDAEIGDKGVPGSFDKNRAQGEKNLQSFKNFFGGNKQTAAPAAAPIPPANPMRGVRESSSSQDPVLVRMQNLAGIRR